eukprot:TRINITY_DN47339_c0_g1_i1.p1 TRINITY_DN47339_c0_g1~~TRINITY_DN47339_c0_g1_i1.p1  ORF type:complete len:155 (+),score=17.72 TRINITY_DN47339_c0_g1_i1:69-533(+)
MDLCGIVPQGLPVRPTDASHRSIGEKPSSAQGQYDHLPECMEDFLPGIVFASEKDDELVEGVIEKGDTKEDDDSKWCIPEYLSFTSATSDCGSTEMSHGYISHVSGEVQSASRRKSAVRSRLRHAWSVVENMVRKTIPRSSSWSPSRKRSSVAK